MDTPCLHRQMDVDTERGFYICSLCFRSFTRKEATRILRGRPDLRVVPDLAEIADRDLAGGGGDPSCPKCGLGLLDNGYCVICRETWPLKLKVWSGEIKKIHPESDSNVFPRIEERGTVHHNLDAEEELDAVLATRPALSNLGLPGSLESRLRELEEKVRRLQSMLLPAGARCHCGHQSLPLCPDPLGRLVHSRYHCFQVLTDFPYYATIGPSGSEERT